MATIPVKTLFSGERESVRNFIAGDDIKIFFTRAPGNKFSPRVRVKEIIRDNLDYAVVVPMNESDGRQTIHINQDFIEIVFN